MNLLPKLALKLNHLKFVLSSRYQAFSGSKRKQYLAAAVLDFVLITVILFSGVSSAQSFIQPLISPFMPLHPLTESKSNKQVFGFAPYWNINKLDNVDFNTLTTFAYFGVEIGADGNLIKDDPGYESFKSKKATELFKKAHAHGTKVVLTVTLMTNPEIRQLMDDEAAQDRAIDQSLNLVTSRGIDGVNIDVEYMGDPGSEYRNRFTAFVQKFTTRMHNAVPNSQVTVSMYASSVKDPKIYDVAELAKISDGIFMMAYDFAVGKSDNAIPTSPLGGHESGKYWYDIKTAVSDFLTVMPADKLILGVPYYGYNYIVDEPVVKAETRNSRAVSQTYTTIQDRFSTDDVEGVNQVVRGWDDEGQVGYVAYHTDEAGWRMIFMEDQRSLGLKYDFAKEQGLAGVGMWALGNDDGKTELWALLEDKFGTKQFADNTISQRQVIEIHD